MNNNYFIFIKSTLGFTRIDAYGKSDLKKRVKMLKEKGFKKITIYNEWGLRVWVLA